MNMLRAFLFLGEMQSQGLGKILLNYAKGIKGISRT